MRQQLASRANAPLRSSKAQKALPRRAGWFGGGWFRLSDFRAGIERAVALGFGCGFTKVGRLCGSLTWVWRCLLEGTVRMMRGLDMSSEKPGIYSERYVAFIDILGSAT